MVQQWLWTPKVNKEDKKCKKKAFIPLIIQGIEQGWSSTAQCTMVHLEYILPLNRGVIYWFSVRSVH